MTFTFAASLVYNAAVVGSTDQLPCVCFKGNLSVFNAHIPVPAAVRPLRRTKAAASMGNYKATCEENAVIKAGQQATPSFFF